MRADICIPSPCSRVLSYRPTITEGHIIVLNMRAIQVEAAVVQLLEEARQQRALLEDQHRHLLQQHSLLLSLQPERDSSGRECGGGAAETSADPHVQERKEEDALRDESASCGIRKRREEEKREAAAEGDDAQEGDGQVEPSPTEGVGVFPCGQSEEKERADAAVATVTALEQLLKVDSVTLILPKLTEYDDVV